MSQDLKSEFPHAYAELQRREAELAALEKWDEKQKNLEASAHANQIERAGILEAGRILAGLKPKYEKLYERAKALEPELADFYVQYMQIAEEDAKAQAVLSETQRHEEPDLPTRYAALRKDAGLLVDPSSLPLPRPRNAPDGVAYTTLIGILKGIIRAGEIGGGGQNIRFNF